jgi:two-component system CheB/CheR fusion protein
MNFDPTDGNRVALLQSIPAGLYVLDDQGRLTWMNPKAKQLFAQLCQRTPEQLLGQIVWQACPEVVDSMCHKEYQRALAEQQAVTFEAFYPALGRWLEVHALPSPGHLAVYFRDVTESKHLQEALRQRADELAELDRGRNEFLTVLAHELRNPLVPIRTTLHLMHQRTQGDAGLERALQMAEGQVQHLSQLIDDLLDVSAATRGQLQLHKERIDLGKVIAQAIDKTRALIESRGHALTVTLPPASLPVQADPARVVQVITQLLNNAALYTKPGGQIGLTAGREHDQVHLHVRDNGIGIAPELLPHVFNLFMQADRLRDGFQGRLGIGLTLVHSLVQLHGGSVQALSGGPGLGSEFIVRLPVLPDHVPAEPETAKSKGMRLRVLVVDDNLEVAQSAALLLEHWGHECRMAYDGPRALEEARTWQPEVILLDIGMPEMDGYEVARRLREQQGSRGMVLVAMTGYGQEEDRRRAREAGFDYHMVKPVRVEDLDELLALADSFLRQGQATRQ